MSAKKNTLFNYFTKSPGSGVSPKPVLKSSKTPQEKTGVDTTPKNKAKSQTPKTNEKENVNNSNSTASGKKSNGCRKRIIEPEDDTNGYDSEEDISPKKLKEEGYELNSEDSGDEYVPEKNVSSESEVEEDNVSESDLPSESDEESPVKKRKRPTTQSKPNKKALLTPKGKTPSKIQRVSNVETPRTPSSGITPRKTGGTDDTVNGDGDGANWSFLKYDFLKPEKIRDAKRRKPSDPDYDPRTLFVPDDFLKNQTPAMKQWWEMKSKHYDCILFFKVGKFYEFYHMDAVTGVKELSLTFMRGEYAHCGFPEIAYGRFSANLVDKGYKVARVEQTETPDMVAERCKKMSRPTKFDRVVAREICQVTTKGTRIFTVVDGESKEATSKYLLALSEKENNNGFPVYGVCFVDTSIGTFHIGQFPDDRHSSRLRTLIAAYAPAQVLYERNHLSKQTEVILNTSLVTALKESLAPETEFWNSTATLMKLAENGYFSEKGMPENLKKFIGEGDSLMLTATDDSELGVRALGAVVWCLSRSLLDHQLLSMAHFEVYIPIDMASSECNDGSSMDIGTKHMVLDSITLRNLNILESSNGVLDGTLLQKLDHCCTPFGKRLLRQWLCSPLINIESIKARQTAISIFRDNPHIIKEAKELLTKVPDLERLLSRIYAQSSKGQPESHPENRAFMFEEKTYSKRKIIEFISVLNGFQFVQQFALMLQDSGVTKDSEILTTCSNFPTCTPAGKFPNLQENLDFFKNAFDHEEAEKEGRILPSEGVDAEYDSALETLKEIEKDLKKYLKEQSEYFGCKVVYAGTDKKRFQLEVAEGASRKAGSGYELVGQRKGYKRYSTPEVKELLERQIAAEDVKLNVLLNLRKRIFSRFSERYNDWSSAIQCVAVLDVILSLAEYACSVDTDICIPEFVLPKTAKKVYVNIQNGKYPCFTGEDKFIPNDTVVGDPSSLLLLTGPNMGGKSTLMRQLGLLVTMAQIGCHVPATSMELTAVDRIFTRIGANDDIMAGESTFYLELCETSAILSHATKHSLVLIDELGRGTSTYDGTAIAASVLKELFHMGCRTIFSTHYHSLVEDFKENQNVHLAHMACMAEAEEEDEEGGTQETVTFLYKLAPGACPKSYGFNAARLAGVPAHITKLGSTRAKQLETEANNRKLFRALFTSSNIKEIINSL